MLSSKVLFKKGQVYYQLKMLQNANGGCSLTVQTLSRIVLVTSYTSVVIFLDVSAFMADQWKLR